MTRSTPAHIPLSMGDMGRMVLVVFFWALCFPGIVWGLPAATPLPFAALRSTLAGAALLLVGWWYKYPLPKSTRGWLATLGIALTYTFIGIGAMFLAAGRMQPAIATVLANTQPLMTALLAIVLLGERPPLRAWSGMLMALAGVGLMVWHAGGAWRGYGGAGAIVLVLVSALGTGAANLIYRAAGQDIDPITGNGLQFACGGALLGAAAWFQPDEHIVWTSTRLWLSLFVLSIFTTAAANVIWQRLLQRYPVSQLTPFSNLTSIFGFALGILVTGALPSMEAIIGIVLVVFGVWLAVKGQRSSAGERA